MSKLLGIISTLKQFLSDTEETITVPKGQTNEKILSLCPNREYIIPDFQREIRWTDDNVALLIDDLESGAKVLR